MIVVWHWVVTNLWPGWINLWGNLLAGIIGGVIGFFAGRGPVKRVIGHLHDRLTAQDIRLDALHTKAQEIHRDVTGGDRT